MSERQSLLLNRYSQQSIDRQVLALRRVKYTQDIEQPRHA
jgi:hypothetical protein